MFHLPSSQRSVEINKVTIKKLQLEIFYKLTSSLKVIIGMLRSEKPFSNYRVWIPIFVDDTIIIIKPTKQLIQIGVLITSTTNYCIKLDCKTNI